MKILSTGAEFLYEKGRTGWRIDRQTELITAFAILRRRLKLHMELILRLRVFIYISEQSATFSLGATYTPCQTVQFNGVKTAGKTELNVLWHSTGFQSGF
jgi:hypothetical protein